MTKSNNFLNNYFFYFLFFIFFVVGITIFKDYGISVDEEFHRFSGFYWLNYTLNFTPFESLKDSVQIRFENINGFTLPDPKNHPFYGVVFDLPLALLETILNIQNEKNYFLLRHFFNFLIFFIGFLYFYKILDNRFKNKIIVFIGTLFYISSPRIFGDIFFNNKDIIFLSLVTIAIYYKFKIIDNFEYKNIFYFSIFSALACACRIVGIFIPISFIFFIFFSTINKNSYINELKKVSFYIFVFFVILLLFWPYLWESPIRNFIYALKVFSKYTITEIYTLFNGKYVLTSYLPLNYLPLWISITTPLITLTIFLIGFFCLMKRFFLRTINIKEKMIYNDFWRGNNEKKDFYIFFNFTLIAIYLFFFNPVLYTGWRQVYFFHFFLIYIACFGLHFLFLKIRKKLLLLSIILFFTFLNFIQIIKLHPYQSLYFNALIQGESKTKFEVDYWGMSGVNFLKKILSRETNSSVIKIAVASFLPLERSLKMLDKKDSKKINIIGQNYQNAEYIFNNNMSEVNKFFNKKYNIPKNFEKVYEFNLNGFMVYEMYKKK